MIRSSSIEHHPYVEKQQGLPTGLMAAHTLGEGVGHHTNVTDTAKKFLVRELAKVPATRNLYHFCNREGEVHVGALLGATELDYRCTLFAANTGVVDGNRHGCDVRIPMPIT